MKPLIFGTVLPLLLVALGAGPSRAQDGWSWGDLSIPKKVSESGELKSQGKQIYARTCAYCHFDS